jgi:ABC-type Zn uptake system ZnuABC Zn-binding protein ZnuA
MRRRYAVVLFTAFSLGLAACSSSSSPSDTVSQPDEEISDSSGGGVNDIGAKAAAANCVSGKEITGRPVRIATTVAPITNLVAAIVGNTGAEVTGIVPEGTNSHTYEPPPSAAAKLENADIVFVNGLSLDDLTRDLAQANAKNAVICEIGTATLPESDWVFDFSFPKEAGKPNPHTWTNPPMVLNYLTVIRDALVVADPKKADTYDANYVKISADVLELEKAMEVASETIPSADRKLLTYHDAYAYFALKYGYTVIGAIQPASFEEPSPKNISDLIAQVKAEKVKAIFGSEVFPSPVLEQIGKETGTRYVDTLRDDDLPGKPGDAEHSWMGLMKSNYITMVEALGGDASALKAVAIDTSVTDKAFYPQ